MNWLFITLNVLACIGYAVTKNFKNKLTWVCLLMYSHRRVSLYGWNQLISFKTPIVFNALMIKQTLKKHATTEEHAIDAKKIVFLKDNFIYYSITY